MSCSRDLSRASDSCNCCFKSPVRFFQNSLLSVVCYPCERNHFVRPAMSTFVQVPTLMEAHSSLLSSIASKSITGLKAFPRGPQYYQTFGDHLLAIMLKRIHKYCTETGLYHHNDLVYQGTPMWKVAEQNTIAHSLMCKKLKLLPAVYDVHMAGDFCEAMLLKLVEINQAHLAFLIASFIFCIAVDPHVRMTCT